MKECRVSEDTVIGAACRRTESFLATVRDMVRIPQTLKALTVELSRLNDNLEGLAPVLNRTP